ncbi:hypothetical protein SAMN05428970_1312 [Agromyces sp. CF514]|uniref:hypothetical protein n=1 Tax=Agromyces sp. CF514 TaxID=1881031 RepID=UPI0008EED861|nr:hypothetical protein [Agromyces sp. CF514]SFR72150.1 hypothetical protein SAMN05428970_1312 [Agromyces sp. CF514]
MSTARLAPKDIDPIVALTSSSILQHFGGAVASLIAIVMTIVHWHEVVSPFAAVLAVLLVNVAAIAATLAARPSRAPFTPERLWIVVVFALGAAVAEYLSTVGNDRYVYDDFGPLVVGVLMISLAPYCSWATLLSSGALSTAVLAVLVAGAGGPAWHGLPVLVMVLFYVAPTVVASSAAAGYSWAIVHITLAWQRKANQVLLQRDAELRAGLAHADDHGRVAVIRREVLPFLASMLNVDRISVADAARARQLAEALRSTLREEEASTWLADVAGDLERRRGIPIEVVETDTAVANLRDDQRAALTALLTWLASEQRVASIRAQVRREDTESPRGRAVRISVDAPFGAEPPNRRSIERLASVARAVGLSAEVAVTGENVTVEFRHVIG